MKSRLALVVLLCATTWQNAANAAEVTCVRTLGTVSEDVRKRILALGVPDLPASTTCTGVLIDGEIVKGDAERFRAILRENQPWISTVYLVSPGGNVAEALAVGRLVRRSLLTTFAPVDVRGGRQLPLPDRSVPCKGEHCICVSACFFIWVAGVERVGNAIGLHRPFIVPEEARKLSLGEAEEAYGRLVDAVQEYLTEMNVPNEYFDRIVRIPSGDLVFLSWRKADKDFGGYVPAIAEWLKSRCGAMTATEEHDFFELGARQHESQSDSSVGGLSAAEEHYYKALRQKYFELFACQGDELTRERMTAVRRDN